ncbi:MAG TPA: Holliday junction resolvase RuvX [Candidatus Paceibacterota bacterium]
MKYLGIDYGSKRIGLAVSDEEGRIAFPREVVKSGGEKTLRYIERFCESEKIGAIILGQSLDYKGAPNPVQSAIANFKLQIESLTKLPVHYQSELWTSAEASRNTAKLNLDASAAALILQSYLDRRD